MQALLDGAPYTATGLPPYFVHAGGSFANGGAMRISPLAVALFNSSTTKCRVGSEVVPEEESGASDSDFIDAHLLRSACAEAVS